MNNNLEQLSYKAEWYNQYHCSEEEMAFGDHPQSHSSNKLQVRTLCVLV